MRKRLIGLLTGAAAHGPAAPVLPLLLSYPFLHILPGCLFQKRRNTGEMVRTVRKWLGWLNLSLGRPGNGADRKKMVRMAQPVIGTARKWCGPPGNDADGQEMAGIARKQYGPVKNGADHQKMMRTGITLRCPGYITHRWAYQ